MIYSNETLNTLSNTLNFTDNQQGSINDFVKSLYIFLLEFENIFDYNISDYKVSFVNKKIVDKYEPLEIGIFINDDLIFDNTKKIEKIKNKEARIKDLTIEKVKFALTLYLEKSYKGVDNIFVENNCIKCNLFSELGFNFKIYLFVSNSINYDTYFLYGNFSLNLNELNLDIYKEKMLFKDIDTNNNYTKVCGILKNFVKDFRILSNTFLLNSLVYCVPNEFFVNDENVLLSNILNYINLSSISSDNFKCIDCDKKIIDNKLFNISIYELKKEINKLCEHFKN